MHPLSPRGRVTPIPDGTLIRGRYRIERFLRGSELRNHYVVSFVDEPGQRLCPDCGSTDNDEGAEVCQECGYSLADRLFVLSERWRTNFQPYQDIVEMGLVHAGLARTYGVFEESQRIFTVFEPVQDSVLIDRGSPLPTQDILAIAFQGCALLEYLHANGVGLTYIGREHLAFHRGEFRLIDPEIAAIYPNEVPKMQRLQDIRYFARVLREFVRYDLPELKGVVEKAYEGRYEHPGHFTTALKDVQARLPAETTEYQAAALSDVGMFRTLNEDSWGWARLNERVSVFIVADGMGGHDSGEIASELAVKIAIDGMRRRARNASDLNEAILSTLLRESFLEANNTVKVYSEKHRSDMGTTLTGVVTLDNALAVVANVGDSRTYLLQDQELLQVTEDHSLVASLVAMGKITKEAARNHPHSNILIRTVGKEWDVEVDVFQRPLRPGDTLLLCSDGLWGELEDQEILALLAEKQPLLDTCEALVRTANRNGGHDNVTALVVRLPA